mgnify:CR=1 FL=1
MGHLVIPMRSEPNNIDIATNQNSGRSTTPGFDQSAAKEIAKDDLSMIGVLYIYYAHTLWVFHDIF